MNAAVLPAALAILCISIGAWVGLDPVLRAIHHNWTSVYGEFAHGYLILVLAIWLGVTRLRRSGHLQPRPYWPALGALSYVSDDTGFAIALGQMQGVTDQCFVLQRFQHGIAAIDRQHAIEKGLFLSVER